jgi:cytochrome P450
MSDAYTMLTDDQRYPMPPVPPATSGIAWLRATVPRFSDGPTHRRRRAYAVAMLADVDPADVSRDAALETAARLDRIAASGATAGSVDLMAAVARPVPVAVLGRALGVQDDALTARIAAVARAYQPDHDGGPDADRRADAAVDALVADDASEEAAARIGILVQACEATAALVRNGLRCGSVEAALRGDPPVPRTRRLRAGRVVPVELSGHPFGAGSHACPGRSHAVAIASAMVGFLWSRAFFFRY